MGGSEKKAHESMFLSTCVVYWMIRGTDICRKYVCGGEMGGFFQTYITNADGPCLHMVVLNFCSVSVSDTSPPGPLLHSRTHTFAPADLGDCVPLPSISVLVPLQPSTTATLHVRFARFYPISLLPTFFTLLSASGSSLALSHTGKCAPNLRALDALPFTCTTS